MNKFAWHRRSWALLILAFFTMTAAFASTASAAEDEGKPNAAAYFCGKRGNLSAPQCVVLLNEVTGNPGGGHVLVCNPGEKVWSCRDDRCDEISGIVSSVQHKFQLNEHLKLCDLVCGQCKQGWK